MGRQVRPLGLGGKATAASHQGGQPGNRPRVPASLPFLPWAGSLHPADTCLLKQCQPATRGTPQGHVNLVSLCSRGDLRQTLGYGDGSISSSSRAAEFQTRAARLWHSSGQALPDTGVREPSGRGRHHCPITSWSRGCPLPTAPGPLVPEPAAVKHNDSQRYTEGPNAPEPRKRSGPGMA